jgi:Mg-chelatase subunit ChlD
MVIYRSSSVGKCVVSFLVLAFGIRPVGAQDSPCSQRTFPVALRDQQNLPIQNVSAADLEAKIRGKPVKMLSLAPDPRPHRLVLVLDASASMGSTAEDTPLFALEFPLAQHFFEVNRQRSQIALLIFNKHITETVDFAQGNAAVGDKLKQISSDRYYPKTNVKGTTALYDTMLAGLDLLAHPSSADALYVLTDAGDNASKHSPADVTQRLAVTRVRLFAVLLHKDIGYRNRTPEEVSGPEELDNIARKSGGEILSAADWHGKQIALSADPKAEWKSQETLARLYQTILADQLLEIELPFPILRDERWELKLSDSARQKWKGAHIIYPTILVKCGSE